MVSNGGLVYLLEGGGTLIAANSVGLFVCDSIKLCMGVLQKFVQSIPQDSTKKIRSGIVRLINGSIFWICSWDVGILNKKRKISVSGLKTLTKKDALKKTLLNLSTGRSKQTVNVFFTSPSNKFLVM